MTNPRNTTFVGSIIFTLTHTNTLRKHDNYKTAKWKGKIINTLTTLRVAYDSVH